MDFPLSITIELLGLYTNREARVERQKADLDSRRAALIPILEAVISDSGTPTPALRSSTTILAAVAGKAHAHRQLMESHTARLKRSQQILLKPQNAGVNLVGC